MARVLTLTTPLMRGDDVRRLQAAVNNRDRVGNIATDGEYGEATDQAVRSTAWLLGVEPVAGSTKAAKRRERVTRFPGIRTPVELARAAKRKKARAASGKGLQAAIRWMRNQVGTKEQPAGSNTGPKIRDWLRGVGIGAAPWCGAFAHAAAKVYGVVLTQDVRYCPSIRGHALAGTGGLASWTTKPATAQAAIDDGRLVLAVYDFGGSIAAHVGVAIKITASETRDVEGNTSSGNSGSQDNGGTVAERVRNNSQIQGWAICRKPA